MHTTSKDKSNGVKKGVGSMPPHTTTPGSRVTGSSAKGGQLGRTGMGSGKGSFSGSAPNPGASADWGSPIRTSRLKSTGRAEC